MRKAAFRRPYLYVIRTETPCGYKYSRFSNTKPEFGDFKVNLKK